jgi:hypothetical protein
LMYQAVERWIIVVDKKMIQRAISKYNNAGFSTSSSFTCFSMRILSSL